MIDPPPRLRVALIGLGNWGSRLLEALLANPDFEVVALCDADQMRLGASPGPDARFRSVSELLNSVDCEAVFVAVTPQVQGQVALEVLAAGRHLFVEKPMSLSSSLAQSLNAVAKRKARIVCVGHLMRYQPLVVEALRLLREGALGRVRRVFCERVGARPRLGVSAWWVLAPHDLSFLLAAFPGDAHWLRVTRDASGATWASLALAGGVRAKLRIAGAGTPRRTTVVVGDGGALVLDEASSTLRRYSCSLVATDDTELDEILVELAELSADIRSLPGQPLQRELEAFFRAVRFGEPLPTDAADGYRVVAALESAELALLGAGPGATVRGGPVILKR